MKYALIFLLTTACTSTMLEGEAEFHEAAPVEVYEADYDPEQIVTGTVEAPCDNPCGDACCPERSFCYEGDCACFAGLDECAGICCPETEPVCVEGVCR
jgi:hypothetical protein